MKLQGNKNSSRGRGGDTSSIHTSANLLTALCNKTKHRMSVRDLNGQCRPSLHLWIKHSSCMQICRLSTASEALFGRKTGQGEALLINSFSLFSSGVLSALLNSWEATSLEICWPVCAALCGGLRCCATHLIFT